MSKQIAEQGQSDEGARIYLRGYLDAYMEITEWLSNNWVSTMSFSGVLMRLKLHMEEVAARKESR